MLAQSPTFRNPFVIAESSAAGYKGSLPRGITNGIHANKVHSPLHPHYDRCRMRGAPETWKRGFGQIKRSPRGGKSHAIATDPHWYPVSRRTGIVRARLSRGRPAVSISDCGGQGVVLLLFMAQSLPASGIACWIKLEIMPPSIPNHSRNGTKATSCRNTER